MMDEKQNEDKEVESQESEDEHHLGELKTEHLSRDSPRDVVPYPDSDLRLKEEHTVVDENCDCRSDNPPVCRIPGIRKDDEFFHFIILCFAIGIYLVCYYKYSDWTISLGISLMTFAALETTGIYFGLMYRIRTILGSFIPLLQRFKIPGLKKIA